MILKQVLQIFELLDKPDASGEEVVDFFQTNGAEDISTTLLKGEKGKTWGIKITIPGSKGKKKGCSAPTLGIIGRLGGIGARPELIGFVSDGDGALTALSVGLKLVEMKVRGDILPGDVIITTHICPDSHTQEHHPVPFMSSPIDMETMNSYEVVPEMDAILSIDTTKGNRIINDRGFAISPTIKEGYILKVSESLLRIMESTTGSLPRVFPVSHQDITPYGNNLYHLNSILQPCTATSSPVVGLALITQVPVPGCATGASHPDDIEKAGRFAIEVAKYFGENRCPFYDTKEYDLLLKLYGSLKHFQTQGK